MFLVIGLILATAMIAGTVADRSLNAQQEPVKRTPLFMTDVAGMEGKEVNVIMVEIAPGAESGKHYHPGDEIGYIVQGSALVEIQGKKPFTVKRGGVIHLRPKEVHNVKNTSKSAPAKALVLGIYQKGEPVATPVK
jgi:quercetin dioxygenase-like cupin family protein